MKQEKDELLHLIEELAIISENTTGEIRENINNLFMFLELKLKKAVIMNKINKENKFLFKRVNNLLQKIENSESRNSSYDSDMARRIALGRLRDLRFALDLKTINTNNTPTFVGVPVEEIEELFQNIKNKENELLSSKVFYNNKYLKFFSEKIFNFSFVSDLVEKIDDKEYLEKLSASVAYRAERDELSESVSDSYEELQLIEYFNLHKEELIKFLPKYLEQEKQRIEREKVANELLNLEKEYLNANKLQKVLLYSKLKKYGVTDFSKISEKVKELLEEKDKHVDFEFKRFFDESKKYSWGINLDLVMQEGIEKESDVSLIMNFETIPTVDEVRARFYANGEQAKQVSSKVKVSKYYLFQDEFDFDLNFVEMCHDEVDGKEAIIALKILNVLGKLLKLSSDDIVVLAENLNGINFNLEQINNYYETVVSSYLKIAEHEIDNVENESNKRL